LNLFNLREDKIRTLHFAWFAFFITFVIWFNHAPLLIHIRESLGLTEQQLKALLVLNVALTIPARILIGILIDRFGPRMIYTGLLVASGLLCFAVAAAQTFPQIAFARFCLGFVGAGFVIGIRLVSEWFPSRDVGLAEGIYGGWGNFGSAAAAMSLPAIAVAFGGDNGWRMAMALTGLLALVYAPIFYRNVRNTPKGSTYFRPKRSGGLEVTSRRDYYFYIGMNIPLFLSLGVLTWNLASESIALLSATFAVVIAIGLFALFIFQVTQIHRVNREMLDSGVPEIYRYKFKQVALLSLAYLVTFGSELAVVSMLPLFFLEVFEGLDPVAAGMFAAAFAFMNLISRPSGGLLSDRLGRRATLQVLVAGLAVGYLILAQIDGHWPIALAVFAMMTCAFFEQAGAGAVFAMVPLIKRRMTGQIAGMTGAYGNVGAVLYLTVLSFVDYSTFFLVIAASAMFVFGALFYLEEPRGQLTEVREDGSVELIEVA
jgi:NNP family nitrate/nitrite transporter-like MFS transporter